MLAFTVSRVPAPSCLAPETGALLVVMLGAFVLAAMFSPWPYLSLAVVLGLMIAGQR